MGLNSKHKSFLLHRNIFRVGTQKPLRFSAWVLISTRGGTGKISDPNEIAMTETNTPINRPVPLDRLQFPVFRSIGTRWADNDIYGHVNNVVYYSWFDTAVNAYLIEQGALDIHQGGTIGLVIETQCNYFYPIAFPQNVDVGLRVSKLGNSSVRYEIGLFAEGEPLTAALGHFVHVYVDRETRRPCALPERLRSVLEGLRT